MDRSIPVAAPDPWVASARIGRQLGAWAGGSVVVGVLLLAVAETAAWRAFGLQSSVWGAIDGAIALAGAVALRRARARGEAGDPARAEGERRRLRRLLVVNAWLDVGYVAIGAAVWVWGTGEGATGHALGVLVQGGFLLAFDTVHAARLRGPSVTAGGTPQRPPAPR